MNSQENASARCRVSQTATGFARRAGLIDGSKDDPEGFKVVESVKQLMAMGLSIEDIEELDIRQPMLQAIFEYMRLEEADRDKSERTAAAIEATLKVISDEMHKLDMELEMLNMRKSALLRRIDVLHKIARSMEDSEDNLLAA